jgi:histidyl-tRNA synthetase
MKKEKQKSKVEKTYLATDCDKVGEIAIQYGFSIIKSPQITPEDISKSKHFKEFDFLGDAEEKIALTRWYMEENIQTQAQPIMIHYKKPLQGSSIKKKSNEEMYGFEIMGSARSTGEALLIKVALAVLGDLGYKDIYLNINSIGDRESIVRFERELMSYYRKHGNILSAKMRQEFKKNHYSIVTDSRAETEDFRKCMPSTIGSLSDLSRLYFKEILEFIEAFDVPYKIKPNIISDKLFASHTVFEIRQNTEKNEEGPLLACGYRYNYLAKKIGGKREIPSVGITITVKKNPKFCKKVLVKKIKKPAFYLVQLGETAKLKALNVVETLRKNKISVYHSITKDKITGQLSGAEYMHASHVLIIGQKEAIENTVVVRDVITREQDTIPMFDLVEFLRKIKI